MKELLLRAVHSPVGTQAIAQLERMDAWRSQEDWLRVLTYHRVIDPAGDPTVYPRIAVTPQAFAEQMAFVAQHYRVISMQELLDYRRGSCCLPPRALLITFDDGYTDFAEHAWPILRRHGLPVTLFVPTAFPDSGESFWWDRLYHALMVTQAQEVTSPGGVLPLGSRAERERAFTRLREQVKSLPHQEAMALVQEICQGLGVEPPPSAILGWDALRRLAEEGVTLGAHTRTHPLMNRLSLEEARAEAVGSLRDLEREIGSALPIFAYPSGGISPEVEAMLAQEGFALAFTTYRKLNRLNPRQGPEWLRLGRINVGPRTSLTLLRAQLLLWSASLARPFA